MARTPKFTAPNLANATPEMLVEESAKLSLIENYAKKMRKVYKEALFGRLNFNPKEPLSSQPDVKVRNEGERFVGIIEQYGQDRFNSTLFKADHPELYAKYCYPLSITKLSFDLKEGATSTNPEIQKLMDELKAELGLDETE